MSTPSETKMDPLYKVPNSGLGRWTKMIVLGNVASEQVCVCVSRFTIRGCISTFCGDGYTKDC